MGSSWFGSKSFDGTVRLYDAAGAPLRVLRGHDLPVAWLDFSPDGRRLASTASDGSVRIWHLRGEDLLERALGRLTRTFTPEERQHYAHLLDEPARR